jgi:hypothetical protein
VTARSLREIGLVTGLLVVGVVLPMTVNAAAGALDIPYSDDFTFRRAALDFHETGQLELGGWLMKTFLGQLLAVQPFLTLSGGSSWAFLAAAAGFTAVGIVGSYTLARRFLPVGRAIAAVLLVLLYPGFMVAAPTFMTDVPAWAAMMACLSLAARALDPGEPGRGRLLGLALAAGVFAFSIREFGLAAPVAVLISVSLSWWAGRRRTAIDPTDAGAARPYEAPVALAWALTLAACLGVVLIATLAGQSAARVHEPGEGGLTLGRRAIATIALAVAPALALATVAWVQRRAWRDRWVLAGSALGLLAGAMLFRTELAAAIGAGGLPTVIVGNVLAATGSTGTGAAAGARPVLFVQPTWAALNLTALGAVLAGGGLLGAAVGGAARLVRERGPAALAARAATPGGLLLVFGGLYLGGTLAIGLVSSLFDRYLWPLILPLGILLLAGPAAVGDPLEGGRRGPSPEPVRAEPRLPERLVGVAGLTAAVVIMGGLAAASLALVLNRAAFDSARWTAGRLLVAEGIPADSIDAGYEWVGAHASQLVIPERALETGERWYFPIAPGFRPCAIVASSALIEPGIRLQGVTRDAYRLLLVGGPATPLYVYRSVRPDCP